MIWLPINITFLYLAFTLLLFAFGPIAFHLRQPFVFYFYMVSYIVSIVVGYCLGIVVSRHLESRPKHRFQSLLSRRHSIFVTIAAICGCYVSLRLESISELLNFKKIYLEVIDGLNNPGVKYAEKMARFLNDQSDKIRAALLFLVAPFKVLLVPYVAVFWKNYGSLAKLFNLYLVFLVYVLPGLQTGTNKPVFDLLIFATVSIASLSLLRTYRKPARMNGAKKILFAGVVVALLVSALGFFSLNMEARGGRVDYIETVSPLNDIRVEDNFRDNPKGLSYLYVWFTSYLVQGYYGFSLALEEEFSSTMGFGNSIFLTRQLDELLGFDFATMTFQRKISPYWNENAQWHSLYSYFANDFHFLGVVPVCFVLGFFLALVWMTFLKQENFWSYLMLPLLGLLIIFIPANNQVFSFLESFSAFMFVFIMWVLSLKIKRF